MKKTSIFAGLSIAALLGTGIIAFAEPTLKEIKAYLNHETIIKFNGYPVADTPITYDGTTYLPVRTLSHLIGARVAWNDQTSTVDINTNKYLPFDEVRTLGKYGYTIQAPKLLDMIHFVVISNLEMEDRIAKGTLDKGTLSAVTVQYLVQDKNLGKLDEEIATIEVLKKADFQQLEGNPRVIAEKDELVYIVKPSTKNPFDSTSNDFSNYEALALHLSTHSYYVKLKQDVEDNSISYENTANRFTLKLPKSWEGKYDVEEKAFPEGSSVRFINKATKVGTLFTISIWSKEYWNALQEDGIIPVSKLEEYGDNVYLFHTPTDVQYDPQDEQSKADYLSMFNDIKTIIATFEIKN